MDEQSKQAVEGNAIPTPGGENQEAVMPTVEQKPAESQGNDGDLPDEVSERTKEQFDKLKAANREMSEKLSKYEGNPLQDVPASGFDADSYSHLNQQQVEAVADNFVDANGYVDVNALNKALREANLAAKRAEMSVARLTATQQKAEQDRQVKEAHEKFPWLNPKDESFDKVKFELVRDRVVRNWATGVAKPLSDIAAEVGGIFEPKGEKSPEEAVEEYKKSQANKAQASAVASGKGQPREAAREDLAELSERTMQGDKGALRERLRRYHEGLKQ